MDVQKNKNSYLKMLQEKIAKIRYGRETQKFPACGLWGQLMYSDCFFLSRQSC
jgi:hypothetical protein